MEANQVTIPKELADWLHEFMNKGGNTIPDGMSYYDAFYKLKACIKEAEDFQEDSMWLQLRDDQERSEYFNSLE